MLDDVRGESPLPAQSEDTSDPQWIRDIQRQGNSKPPAAVTKYTAANLTMVQSVIPASHAMMQSSKRESAPLG